MNNEKLPEWKRLLRGGFAYEAAPFAAHPLDKKRATRMFHLALHEGVSIEEIKEEARAYLLSRGIDPQAADDEVKEVKSFCNSFKISKPKKTAWLVSWEYVADDVSPIEDRVIAIVDPRISIKSVQEFVYQFHMANNYSLSEKLYYSTRRRKNPYPAEINNPRRDTRIPSTITCGHNPFILAKIVYNLQLVEGPDSSLSLMWDKSQKQA